MKRAFLGKLTYLSLVLLMVVSLVPVFALTASAAEQSVTLSFSGGSGKNGEWEFVDNTSGVSSKFAAGTHSTKPRLDASCVRFYGTSSASNTLTVSAPGKITKIVFTMNGSYNMAAVSADSGSIDTSTFTWTGSAESVKFTTTAQTRFERATITYSSASSGEGSTACEHINKTLTDALDATCTAKGNIAYYTCGDCGKFFDATTNEEITENDIEIAEIDHNYVSGTCTVCGTSVPLNYTFDYTTGTNGTELTGFTQGLVTLDFSKGNNANNAPKWYSTGTAIRFYTSNTLTISTIEGYYIKSIAITITQGTFAVDSGTFAVDSGKINKWTAANNETTSVVFTNTNSEQARVSNIAIELGAICKHTNTEAIGEYVAPSCTETGMSAGSKCSDCGEVIEEQVEIEATGHTAPNAQGKCDTCGVTVCVDHDFSVAYTITEPTCTEPGEAGFKCSICGEPSDENKSVLDATGHSLIIDVPAVSATCTTAGSTAAQHCSVCDYATEAETIEATGHTYTNGKCTDCGERQKYYSLVTDASSLAAGDTIIIVAKDFNFALSTTQNTNNRPHVGVTKYGNIISSFDGVQIITLEAGTKDGTFAFNTGSGYLYAASSSSNNMKTQEKLSDNSSWTIEIADDGVATVKAQGTYTRNWLKYNNTSSIFSCYGSGQTDIAIYKLVDAPSVTGVAATLNQGATLNVRYDIPESLLAVNKNAVVVFKVGSEVLKTIPAVSGTQVYSYDMTPGYINDNITIELMLGDASISYGSDVSLNSYKQKFEAASYEQVGVSEAQYNAIVKLLGAIMVYADAADNNGSLTNDFAEVDDFTTTNKYTENEKVLTDVRGVLGAQASLTAEFANIKDTYNVEISVNGVSLGSGKLINNVNAENKIVIKGISAVKFNDVIFIEVTEDTGEEAPTVIASLSISFNQYFKFLNTSESTSDNYKNLAVASYLYGLAAEEYLEASAK